MTKTIMCCEKQIICFKFTNTCPTCGKDYNTSGQLLAPRSQWGEETGESVEEILEIDNQSVDELLE